MTDPGHTGSGRTGGARSGPGELAEAFGELQSSLAQAFDGVVSRLVHGAGRCGGCGEAPGRAATASASPPGPRPDLTPEEEQRLLASVEEYLERGRALDRWWRDASATGRFARRFGLGRTFNQPSESYGFFDRAAVDGREMPVMGNFQEMLYDQPKSAPAGAEAAGQWMRRQVREFVLRYFMRVSDFREPEGYVAGARTAPGGLLKPLSWCPDEEVALKGFGFRQLYYKRRDTGEVGQFPAAERSAIVDLRELGERYAWIVVQVRIFDFTVSIQPFGPGTPRLELPMDEASYLVLSRDLIRAEESPAPGVAGRYGVGYAFIKSPRQGLLGYGPGEFDAAIERIDFEVSESGRVRVPMLFVANRPQRILNLALDPVGWALQLADLASMGLASRLFGPVGDALRRIPGMSGRLDPVYTFIDLANLGTGGLAARELCISREQLEKDFLVKHYMQHYQTVAGSIATWRRVADWLDEAALPDWVRSGRIEG